VSCFAVTLLTINVEWQSFFVAMNLENMDTDIVSQPRVMRSLSEDEKPVLIRWVHICMPIYAEPLLP